MRHHAPITEIRNAAAHEGLVNGVRARECASHFDPLIDGGVVTEMHEVKRKLRAAQRECIVTNSPRDLVRSVVRR